MHFHWSTPLRKKIESCFKVTLHGTICYRATSVAHNMLHNFEQTSNTYNVGATNWLSCYMVLILFTQQCCATLSFLWTVHSVRKLFWNEKEQRSLVNISSSFKKYWQVVEMCSVYLMPSSTRPDIPHPHILYLTQIYDFLQICTNMICTNMICTNMVCTNMICTNMICTNMIYTNMVYTNMICTNMICTIAVVL